MILKVVIHDLLMRKVIMRDLMARMKDLRGEIAIDCWNPLESQISVNLRDFLGGILIIGIYACSH